VKKSRITHRFIGIGQTGAMYQLFNLVNMSRSRTPELKFTFKHDGIFLRGPGPRIRYRGFEVTYHADGATHFKAEGTYRGKRRKLPIERIRNPFVVFQIIVQKYATLPRFRGTINQQNVPISLHLFEEGVQVDVYLHRNDVPAKDWVKLLAPMFTLTFRSLPVGGLGLTVLCHAIDPELRRRHEKHGENAVVVPDGLVSYVPNGSGFGVKDEG
jgi:hypothetical protein